MIKNNKIAFGLFVVIFLIIWNAAEYLYTTFITRSAYQFTTAKDLIEPLVVSILIGWFIFLRK